MSNSRKQRKLFSHDGYVLIGECYLDMITPNNLSMHFMDFDRKVCKLGLKRFVRPRLVSDSFAIQVDERDVERAGADTIIPEFTGMFILVVELTEGCRQRVSIDLMRKNATADCIPSRN